MERKDPVRVVVADDHAVMRDGLRAILDARDGIEVVAEAGDGREAVAKTRELDADVVVMDVGMPSLNGIDATRQIRERCPGTEVVILSMHGSKEYVYQALRAGARGYVLKETAGREVVAAVEAVAAGRRYLCGPVTEIVADDYLARRRQGEDDSPLERLSDREREVLQLVVEGHSSKEIGATLHLSPKTVDTYRSRVMRKLELDNLPALVRFAMEHGLGRG